MTIKETVETLAVEVAKATPAGTTLTLSLFGVPITQWAAILSIIVLLLQGYFLIRNNIGDKNDRDKKRSRSRINRSSEPDRSVDPS